MRRWAASVVPLLMLPVLAVMSPQAVAAPDSRLVPVTEATASAQAVESGEPVVVDSETDEQTMITALPDGSFQADLAASPVRTQDAAGQWHPIDLDLHAVGGHVEPTMAPGDLEISDGGPAGSEIARYSDADGVAYAVKSPWALPAPILTGAMARFVDVLPDVDLVVEAGETGFSHNWVVKTPEAAANPQLAALTLPTVTQGSTVHPVGGGLSYEAADRRVGWTPTPVMWDSSGVDGNTPTEAVDGGPSQGDAVSTVGLSVTDDTLTLKPDTSLLESADTQFPVVIDPYYMTYEPKRTAWTAVWSNYPTKQFYGTQHTLGAGYEGFEQYKKVRSFFRFSTSKLAGKLIISAEMNVLQVHAASCSAYSAKVYRSGAIGTSTTWNHQPSTYEYQSSNSKTTGCGSGPDGYVGWNVKTGVTKAAAAKQSTSTYVIKADEDNRNAWKQFEDDNAALSVRYVSYPTAGTGMQIGTPTAMNTPCGTSSAPAAMNPGSSPVTLKVVPHGPDPINNLKGGWRVQDVASGSYDDVNSPTYVSSGATTTLSWSSTAVKFLNGHTYKINSRSAARYDDASGDSHALYSSWSTSCYVIIDTSAPPAPTLTDSSGAAVCAAKDLANCAIPKAAYGETVTVTATPAPGELPKSYVVTPSNGTSYTVAANSAGKAEIPVKITREFELIKIQSKDAVNLSPVAASFIVTATRPDPVAAWTLDDASGSTLANTVAGGPSLTRDAGSTSSDAARIGTALKHTGTAPTTGTVTVSSAASFTVSGWVRVDDGASGTAFSMPGTTGSAFELDFAANHWSIVRTITDTASTTETVAATMDSPTSAWTQVVATYDATSKAMRLYVNGELAATKTMTSTAWTGAGEFWVGCAKRSGAAGNCLNARLDQIAVYSTVLTPEHVLSSANPKATPGTADAATAGRWFDTANPAADAVGLAPLTVSSGASFGPSTGIDELPDVLLLPTAAARASTGARLPVLDSSGSFTIDLAARVADPAVSGVIARGGGGSTGVSPWSIRYVAGATAADDGRWEFVRAKTNAATGGEVVAAVTATDDSTVFTDLTAVYDGEAHVLRFYVNGEQAEDDTDHDPAIPFASAPWAGLDSLTLGGVSGEVADLTVSAGALSDSQVRNLHS